MHKHFRAYRRKRLASKKYFGFEDHFIKIEKNFN